MPENLGKAVLELTTDSKLFDAGMNKAHSSFKSFLGGAAKVVSVASGILATLGVAAIKLASDAEEVGSKFDAVFKGQSESVRAWAEEYSDSVGRATVDNIGFLATIQDTFVPLGVARDAAAELSKSVVMLSTDLASFNNLPTAQVVNDIQSALVGNHETVRKYGVVLTEATINQELLNMGIIGGYKAATAAEKAQARLNLIMKGTADAQGDAIRTADSFANQLRRTQSILVDLGTTFGETLLPVASEVISTFNDMLKELGENAELFESMGQAVSQIGKIFVSLIPKVFDLLEAVLPLLNAIFDVVAVLIEALEPAIDIIIDLFAELAKDLAPLISLIGDLLVPAIKILTPVLRVVAEVTKVWVDIINIWLMPIILGATAILEGFVSVLQALGIVENSNRLTMKGMDEAWRTHNTLRQTAITDSINYINKQIALNQLTREEAIAQYEARIAYVKKIEAQGGWWGKIAQKVGTVITLQEELDALQADFAQQDAETAAQILAAQEAYNDALTTTTGIVEESKKTWHEYFSTIAEGHESAYEWAKSMHNAELESLKKMFEGMAEQTDEATAEYLTSWMDTLSELIETFSEVSEEFEINTVQWQEAWGDLVSFIQQSVKEFASNFQFVMGFITDIWGQSLQNQMVAADNKYKKDKEHIEATITDEAEKEKALEALDEKYQAKKAELKKQEFVRKKVMDTISAIINTALGVTRALEWGFPLGPIFAGIIGALGAAQIGLIVSAPMPEFSKGGEFDVPPGYPNDSFPMMVESGEHVSVTRRGENSNRPIVIERINIHISFPNANLENMDQGQIERIFRRKFIPALRDAVASGEFARGLI